MIGARFTDLQTTFKNCFADVRQIRYPDAQYPRGRAYLSPEKMIVAAVKARNIELVRAIVEGRGPRDEGLNNSDIDERSIHLPDDFGDTPLIWAAVLGDKDMVGLRRV